MLSHRMFSEIRCISSNWKQVKRFAGHSKWHNIRHTKAAKDSERAHLIARKLRDIKVVVSGSGWNTDVKQNPALAKAVDSAVRANVPKETLDTFFKRLKEVKEIPIEFRLRGPNDCILILTYSSTLQSESDLRAHVKKILSKCRTLELTTGFQHAFEMKGIILANSLGRKATMDDAEEAAIISGAEEVRPEDHDQEVFRYLTEPGSLWSVAKALRESEWNIIEANLEALPTYLVDLEKSQLENVMVEAEKLMELPEFLKVVDNIA